MSRSLLNGANRLVVKAGTSSLTGEDSRLASAKVEKLVRELMELRRRGKEIILVSSGAIGAGVGRLNLAERPVGLSELQAAAAVGQGILMQTYEHYFDRYGQPVAQLLLTRDDFAKAARSKNLRNTLETLMGWGVIPIINENDTVAVEEIKVGDNDTLAAYVAVGVGADLLVMLTDVDGLYTADPNSSSGGELVTAVEEVTPEVEGWASRAGKGFGGMYTKVRAAKLMADHGIPTVIVNGEARDVLRRVLEGVEIGTLFLPKKEVEA